MDVLKYSISVNWVSQCWPYASPPEWKKLKLKVKPLQISREEQQTQTDDVKHSTPQQSDHTMLLKRTPPHTQHPPNTPPYVST